MSNINTKQLHKFGCILLLLLICSCNAFKKKTTYGNTPKKRTVSVAGSEHRPGVIKPITTRKKTNRVLSVADNVINTALTFSGTRYKYGGTTKKGMDCSGLLYVAFGEHDVQLPRVSYNMAEKGKRVRITNVEKGDLLFFKTKRRARKINHVGMVVAVEGDEIKFIHASSSRGVIVSSLREGFWNKAFVKATRVL